MTLPEPLPNNFIRSLCKQSYPYRTLHVILSLSRQNRLPEGGSDELALLSQIVNHMLDEISRLMDEVKSAFDGIAHDVRTPRIHIRSLLARVERSALKEADAQFVQQAAREADVALTRFAAILRIS